MHSNEMAIRQKEYLGKMIHDLDQVFRDNGVAGRHDEVRRELERCALVKSTLTKRAENARRWEELMNLLLFLEEHAETGTTARAFIEVLKQPLDGKGHYSAWDRCVSGGVSAALLRQAAEEEKKAIEKRAVELQKLAKCYELIGTLMTLQK